VCVCDARVLFSIVVVVALCERERESGKLWGNYS